jgi:acetyl-CoA synthetase
MLDTPKQYSAHLSEFEQIAYVKGRKEYEELYRESIEDPEVFWARQAIRYLCWEEPWDTVLRYDLREADIEWFGGGVLNASANCLDRHMFNTPYKVAYYWEGDDPGQKRIVTYEELYKNVNKMAAALKAKGVGKGDRVVLYMPMIVELPVAVLACARIGAIHSVVFGGFSAEALSDRIADCDAKAVFTADGVFRGGKMVALKKNVDEALEKCPNVETVIVYQRTGMECHWKVKRDHWWHDLMSDPELPDYIKPEPMNSEDPLFILYTSGSTGKPKGVVHTHAGYLLHAAITTQLSFDLKPEDVFWCTADIGWITGHTYGIYGPLINGLTSVLFEGVPSYPDYDRFWQIVERYMVTKFYTAPTAIRALAKEGEAHIEKHDISSLQVLGTVGEPINPEAWRWYYYNIGGSRCPIIDTWWQTETGGHMLTSLPGVTALKPGSCGKPFFGVDPVILDTKGRPVDEANQEGLLCMRKPWPGMARTIYGDHERFKETYFSTFPGFYFTGDGAKKDEDGYFRIIGRIDDVINVSGHRLGTAEIESALVLHQNVAEAAVVGYPHQIKGQGIYAYVTLKKGVEASDELAQQLTTLVRTQIGPIATIDGIQWAEQLPKTRSGKIMRRILKKIAVGETDALGDLSTVADPSIIEVLIENAEMKN